jgi:carbon storage regulator CsrA
VIERSNNPTSVNQPLEIQEVFHQCQGAKKMLVLSRKKNESIIIGDNVRIEVLQVKGNTIRLGISAPQEVKVLRGELSPFEVPTTKSKSVDQKADSKILVAESGKGPMSLKIEIDSEGEDPLPNPFVAQAV